MKYFFIACLLISSFALSAQDLLLRGSFGVAGLTQAQVDVGPTGDVGLGLVFRETKKLQILTEVGVQRTDYTDNSGDQIPCFFPFGDKIFTYSNSETYRMQRTEGYLGTGLGYTLGKFQITGTARTAYRLHNKLTYMDALYQSNASVPTIFITEIRPGEEYRQNSATNTINYNSDFHFQVVLGLNYQLTDRFSLGIDHVRTVGNYDLERYTLKYCDTCLAPEGPILERRIDAGMQLFRLTGSIKL